MEGEHGQERKQVVYGETVFVFMLTCWLGCSSLQSFTFTPDLMSGKPLGLAEILLSADTSEYGHTLEGGGWLLKSDSTVPLPAMYCTLQSDLCSEHLVSQTRQI